MKVIGIIRSEFRTPAPENKEIKGFTYHCVYPLTGTSSNGMGTYKFFMSDEKLSKNGYTPAVNEEVDVSYNRYGKPESIRKISK